MVARVHARRGASRLGCLIQVAIVAVLAYCATIAGQEAFSYYRLKDAMKNEAGFASVRTDDEIRTRLRAFTDSVKLPHAARDINVVREGNEIRIWSEYDQVIKLPLNRTRVFHLRPSVKKTF